MNSNAKPPALTHLRHLLYLRTTRRVRASLISVSGYLIGALLISASGSLLFSGYMKALALATGNIETTERQMAEVQREYERLFRRMGHTVRLFSPVQGVTEVLATGVAAHLFDESIVQRISGISTVHLHSLCPVLRKRVYVPELNRTVFLLGAGNEINGQRPDALLEQPASGTVFIGYELHRQQHLAPGDTVRLFGKKFIAGRCGDMSGSRDDITIVLDISDLRTLTGVAAGMFNEVLAVSRLDAESLRKVLLAATGVPMTVIYRENRMAAMAKSQRTMEEASSRAIARERATLASVKRTALRRFIGIVAGTTLLSLFWTLFIIGNDLRRSRPEIAVYTATGVSHGNLYLLFVVSTAVVVFTGGSFGAIAGLLAGNFVSGTLAAGLIPAALIVPLVQTLVAACISLILTRRHLEKDPATLLRVTEGTA
ncbi:MAG: hypothetical protein JW863_15075 [Chitinispirillaceae bacterium]|nr:hypothetical protein [Chitinispirillaceae bacterium]